MRALGKKIYIEEVINYWALFKFTALNQAADQQTIQHSDTRTMYLSFHGLLSSLKISQSHQNSSMHPPLSCKKQGYTHSAAPQMPVFSSRVFETVTSTTCIHLPVFSPLGIITSHSSIASCLSSSYHLHLLCPLSRLLLSALPGGLRWTLTICTAVHFEGSSSEMIGKKQSAVGSISAWWGLWL